MPDHDSELLVMFQRKKGAPLSGASRSVIDTKNDNLALDFKFGNYVEIDDIDFGIGLVDSDSSATAAASTPPPPVTSGGGHQPVAAKDKEKREGKFSKFIQGTSLAPANGQTKIYPVTFDEVSISRQMDRSSPILFQTCFQTKSLDCVSVIKRIGTGVGNTITHLTFLRIDFDDVLITDLSWTISGTVEVKEKMKFVFRTVSMQFLPQNNDGSYAKSAIPSNPLSLMSTAAAGSGSGP